MENRRDFFKSVAALGMAEFAGISTHISAGEPPVARDAGSKDRGYWLSVLEKISTPVLESLSRRKLKKEMPFESSVSDRARYTHLEAFGRLLAGIAPWLATQKIDEAETKLQRKFINLAQTSLDAATDPASPDFMNFSIGGQPLVDAAFMAQGILRAPEPLWHSLDQRVQRQIVAALKSSRGIGTPKANNWVMFAATIEIALRLMGEATVEERLEHCVHRMLGWYKGDGVYGDGEFFHFDYYNSFVIHPMLIDVLAVLKEKSAQFTPIYETELRRAKRFAAIQERLVAPDGTFPPVGRSITYRFGVFHALAQMALLRQLPEPVQPPQVRSALTAVMRHLIEAPETFDSHGWLRIGFCGHQPALAEDYISTGSLYLCSVALLPLGLPHSDEFWSKPAAQWTSQQIWSGKNLHPDHAMSEAPIPVSTTPGKL